MEQILLKSGGEKKQVLHNYVLDFIPYFLLSEEDKRQYILKLASLLSLAKYGMLYVARKKALFETLGNTYTIYNNIGIIQTQTELDLKEVVFPQRPIIKNVYPDYLQTDTGYARVFAAYSFATSITEAALSDVNFEKAMPELIETIVQFETLNKDKVRSYITNLQTKLQKFRSYGSSASELEVLNTTAATLLKDFDMMASEAMKFRVLFVLHAQDKPTLAILTKELIMQTEQDGLKVEAPKYVQHILYNLEGNIAWRYSSALSIAKLYPLSGTSLIEPNGFLLGVDDKGNPIVINPFNSTVRANPHIILSGTTGAGKTTTTALLIDRMKKIYNDLYVFVIDPLANFNRFFSDVNGVTSHVWTENDYMGLDPVRLSKEAGLNLGDLTDFLTENYNIPAKLRGLLATYVEKVSSLKELRSELDNDIKDLRKEGGRGGRNLEDLQAYLHNITSMPDKVIYYGEFPEELAKSDFAILGLKTGDNRHKRLAGLLLVLWAWSIITKLPRERKKMLVIDEAHTFLVYPAIAKMLAYIVKTARNMKTSVVLITQLVSDFNKNEYARDVFQLADTKLVLRQEDTAATDLKELAKLSDEEVDYVLRSGRGEGVLKTGSVKTFLKVVLTEDEKRRWRTE